ncbi:hypothetical protein FSC37_08295 [Piscinibacter aquaticus]|uniref:Uncharacterized protein n=1 Tax=Piscinibacter aquaticus TaxID=392597 RepID=A0A5C6U2M0_9BURK|nr:hypothetical protein FSC37_08295 [Piscinibacter aquaticus]
MPVGPAAGQDVGVHRLEGGFERMVGQVADHDHREAAVGHQRAREIVARHRIGLHLGGKHQQPRAVGGRQLDELQRGQRGAVALAADVQLLHQALARRGDAGQQPARRSRADVVHGDVVGMQMIDLLLKCLGRRAGHEQFAFAGADLPANLAAVRIALVIGLAHHLGGECRLRTRGLPSLRGVGRVAERAGTEAHESRPCTAW